MSRLDGRGASVTGFGQGIGAGVARCLARVGAQVVITDRVHERLAPAVAEVQALGIQALGVPADVTRAAWRGDFSDELATLSPAEI